jgi:hypothetical protein
MDSQVKRIILPETKTLSDIDNTTGCKKIENKKKEKRKVTHRKQWDFNEDELTNEKQLEYIQNMYSGLETHIEFDDRIQHIQKIIENQIKTKIHGYHQQDMKKNLYDTEKFITFPKVIELLHSCKNTCYYCREPVLVLYELVRDNKQWSVERRNNSYGHNHDNVEIACLHCNVCRKTMNEERFLFTKQLNIIKQS